MAAALAPAVVAAAITPGAATAAGADSPHLTEASGDGGIAVGGPEKLRLVRAKASPGTAWYAGRPARFRFEIDGPRRRNLVVQVKRKGGHPAVVSRFSLDGVRRGVPRSVEWDGRVDGARRYARQGIYTFRVRARRGGAAKTKGAAGDPRVRFFKHKFPVRGAHTYGDGLGAGRHHRGQDVFAACGTKLQAARGGRIQHRGFQGSGAGHYLVIDGKGTGTDYAYMHLRRASPFGEGERVRTGQTIGAVGETGNASGCHLHFELWSAPGWYAGGRFLDPAPRMRAWDRWS